MSVEMAWTLSTGQALLIGGAAVGAGLVNAIAGGGTLLTFPALLAVGVPPVAANTTNTLALWPGQLSGAFAYSQHIRDEKRMAILLAMPSILGGIVGSALVLALPEKSFEAAIPWLIFFACALLAFQGTIKKLLSRIHGSDHPAALWAIMFLISVYGGYFGAGMGILMLAGMGILLASSAQHANALKVLFSFLVNGVAAIYFLFHPKSHINLPAAVLMAVGATIGGWLGARLAQKLPPIGVRVVSIGIGLYAAVRMLLR
jgi:uncharacterized membrane protein YfcA